MSFPEVFALAFTLAMDAFAVSVAAASSFAVITWRHYFRLGFHFGLFQFLMPVLGWLLGVSVHEYIEAWDHWVAFGLLSLVGLNMLKEAFFGEEEGHRTVDPSRGVTLVVLSVATSIDALAVGLSLAMIEVSVWFPAVVIGLVCALLTMVGIVLGRRLGRSDLLGRKASVAGACVLLGIGVKILYEHGVL